MAYAIVGAAVVGDIMGMVVLSVSNGLALGSVDAMGIVLILLGAILFIVVGAWLGSHLLVKLVFNVRVSGYRRKLPMSGFILALAIAFLYAFIAGLTQISYIVVAFGAGTAFSGSVLKDGFRKGMQYLEALFVPLFFVSLGRVAEFGEIWQALAFAILLTVTAVVTKIVGCGVPARLLGMGRWDSIAVGVGMVPRQEIALLIAFFGLASYIIDTEVYSVDVFTGLVTALFAPSALRRALKRGGHKLMRT